MERYSQACDNASQPDVIYDEGSWLDRPPTPDQQRIEAVLDRMDLHGKSLLHVGIGSSDIATRFGDRLAGIVGITVLQDEIDHARSLAIRNYSTSLMNKYSSDVATLPGPFNVIVDNNPSSFACCRHHTLALFEQYVDLLGADGVIVTDQQGLAYRRLPSSFGMSYDDLVELQRVLPVRVFKYDDDVYGMRRKRSRRWPRALGAG